MNIVDVLMGLMSQNPRNAREEFELDPLSNVAQRNQQMNQMHQELGMPNPYQPQQMPQQPMQPPPQQVIPPNNQAGQLGVLQQLMQMLGMGR